MSCPWPASADVWPRFRGPNGQGLSDAKTLPSEWSAADYAWTIDLPGRGLSSPVVWNDRLFVTSADAAAPKGILQAVEPATGEILWQRATPLTSAKMNRLNSYATGTPALAENRVYTLWCTAQQLILEARDHDGRMIFQKDFGPTVSSHGPGVSPMLVDGLVVFTHEQRSDLPGFWIAVDAETGQERWRIQRDHDQISYSTPCLRSSPQGSRELVFTSLSHGFTGVAPADGALLWNVPEALPARVVSSPVLAGTLVVGSCGRGGGGVRLSAVQPPAATGRPGMLKWSQERNSATPYVPTSLYHDGLLYTFHDQGTISCLDAASGDILWSEKPAGRFYGSPVWAAGRIYCITREGQCVVLQAGRTYQLLAVNELGEVSDATPAVADERMFLRTATKLMCLAGQPG
jgi:outer membrane protein assembly factor BamB